MQPHSLKLRTLRLLHALVEGALDYFPMRLYRTTKLNPNKYETSFRTSFIENIYLDIILMECSVLESLLQFFQQSLDGINYSQEYTQLWVLQIRYYAFLSSVLYLEELGLFLVLYVLRNRFTI